MARGIGTVEGPAAVAWVGGLGLAMLVSALMPFLLARSARRRAARERAALEGPADGPYRADPASAAAGAALLRRARERERAAWTVVIVGVIGQLLYVKTYVEAVLQLLGRRVRPFITFDLFFWVLLVSATVLVGIVASRGRSAASARERR